MKKLEYSIDIHATKEKVWDTMLAAATYEQWTSVSWPGAFYKGEWTEGTDIRFIGADGSGVLAHISSLKPNQFVALDHIAVLLAGGIEDRESEMAKTLVGTKESYFFVTKGSATNLTVEIITNPVWETMFNDGWPKALAKLKALCENE